MKMVRREKIKPKPALKTDIVIGIRIKEKNLWKRLRDFIKNNG